MDSGGSSKHGQQGHLRAEARGVRSDHASQERGEKQSHGPQDADDDEQPEEDPVNDHGHVLPVFLHLQGERTQTQAPALERGGGVPLSPAPVKYDVGARGASLRPREAKMGASVE